MMLETTHATNGICIYELSTNEQGTNYCQAYPQHTQTVHSVLLNSGIARKSIRLRKKALEIYASQTCVLTTQLGLRI